MKIIKINCCCECPYRQWQSHYDEWVCIYIYPNLYVCPNCHEQFSIAIRKPVSYCPVCGKQLLIGTLTNRASEDMKDFFSKKMRIRRKINRR